MSPEVPLPKTLFIVDAFAFLYRAHYANPNLDNGAAFFFARMMENLIVKHQPSHMVVVFDTDGSLHRAKLLPTYKEGRAERPQMLDAQLPLVKRIVATIGCHCMELPGHEADDLIGSLAYAASGKFDSVVIVTPDKDMLQLVNDVRGVKVLDFKGSLDLWYDAAGVMARLGVRPSQVVDYLTLVGDASDAVPGVPGIGEKGAAGLLGTYGSLEGVMASLGKLKATYREGLTSTSARIPQSRALVTIVNDLQVPDPASFTYVRPSNDILHRFFVDLGMPSLAPKEDLDDFEL